jgi:hypothetical protein
VRLNLAPSASLRQLLADRNDINLYTGSYGSILGTYLVNVCVFFCKVLEVC